MSISAMTRTVHKCPIPNSDRYFIAVQYVATGDASGGNVAYTDTAMAVFFPQNCVVHLIDGWTRHTAANTVISQVELGGIDWEATGTPSAPVINPVFMTNLTNQLTISDGTTQYYLNNFNVCHLPFYLGRPQSTTINITTKFSANTDTKSYASALRFLLQPVN